MKAIEYLDHPPSGWFALDVMRDETSKRPTFSQRCSASACLRGSHQPGPDSGGSRLPRIDFVKAGASFAAIGRVRADRTNLRSFSEHMTAPYGTLDYVRAWSQIRIDSERWQSLPSPFHSQRERGLTLDSPSTS
jgi:hypothetical protein